MRKKDIEAAYKRVLTKLDQLEQLNAALNTQITQFRELTMAAQEELGGSIAQPKKTKTTLSPERKLDLRARMISGGKRKINTA